MRSDLTERADLVVRAGRIVAPDGERPGALVVRAGRIERIAGRDDALDAVETLEVPDDAVVLPGVVDTHVHVNEPGRTEWEGFATATKAALAGGVTTIVDMPLNSIPPTIDVAALELKRRTAAGRTWVDVGFWGGAVPENLDQLEPLHEAGVFGVKGFLLPSGVDEFGHLDEPALRSALATLASFDGVLLAHAEDGDHVSEMHGVHYRDFVDSRPDRAEVTAVARLIAAARDTGARIHIVHVSSAEVIDLITQARAEGVRITAETCPHYLTFAAEEIPDASPQYKCCPPIRSGANRERLWEALRDGTIDIVVTDHSPATPELKFPASADLGHAWGGIASLQLGLAAVWTAAAERGFALTDVVGWMSRGPARFAGLEAKGALAPGADADFVVFAPDERFVVRAERLQHRHPITPYDGRELTGVVRGTWLRGTRITVDGAPSGRLLTPNTREHVERHD